MPLVTRSSNQNNVFVQNADPGAIGAGRLWSDTDAATLFRRNDANDGWETLLLGSQTFEILDSQTLGAGATNITFTPSTALDMADYSAIWIFVDGDHDTAADLSLEWNSLVTGYTWNWTRNIAGTETTGTQAATTEMNVMDTLTSSSAARPFTGWILMQRQNIQTTDRPALKSWFNQTDGAAWEFVTGSNTAADNVDTFSEFIFQVGAGNLLTGTRMTTYGIRRSL